MREEKKKTKDDDYGDVGGGDGVLVVLSTFSSLSFYFRFGKLEKVIGIFLCISHRSDLIIYARASLRLSVRKWKATLLRHRRKKQFRNAPLSACVAEKQLQHPRSLINPQATGTVIVWAAVKIFAV